MAEHLAIGMGDGHLVHQPPPRDLRAIYSVHKTHMGPGLDVPFERLKSHLGQYTKAIWGNIHCTDMQDISTVGHIALQLPLHCFWFPLLTSHSEKDRIYLTDLSLML